MEGWGRRIQKSIFECELDPDEDRCLAFRQCEGCNEAELSIGKSIELERGKIMID